MDLQVRLCLSGETHVITMPLEASLSNLHQSIADSFGTPAYLQNLMLGSDQATLCGRGSCSLVELGVESGSIIFLGVAAEAWLWADATGTVAADGAISMPVEVPDIVQLVSRLAREPDEKQLDPQHGIVHVFAEPFPSTAQEVLQLLRGEGGRRPVIPDTSAGVGAGPILSKELFNLQKKAPWWDLQELVAVGAEHVEKCTEWNGVTYPKQSARAMPALTCCTNTEDLAATVSKCAFYTHVELDEEAEERCNCFVMEDMEMDTPVLIICANPEKRTLSFAYTCTFHD